MKTPNASLLLVLAALTFGAGCSEEPAPLPESLSAAYADLLSWRDGSPGTDSTAFAHGVDSILARHGFTRTTYSEAFQRIGTNEDGVNAFFDSTFRQLTPPPPAGQ